MVDGFQRQLTIEPLASPPGDRKGLRITRIQQVCADLILKMRFAHCVDKPRADKSYCNCYFLQTAVGLPPAAGCPPLLPTAGRPDPSGQPFAYRCLPVAGRSAPSGPTACLKVSFSNNCL